MFCLKCGAQLKDGTKYCKYCGAKTIYAVSQEEQKKDAGTTSEEKTGGAAGQSGAPKDPSSGSDEKKGMTKKVLIIVAIAAAALLAAIVLLVCTGTAKEILSTVTSQIQDDSMDEEQEEEEKAAEEAESERGEETGTESGDEEEAAKESENTAEEKEDTEDAEGAEDEEDDEDIDEDAEDEEDKDEDAEDEEDEEDEEDKEDKDDEEEEEAVLYDPFEHIEVTFSGTSPNGTASIDVAEDDEEDSIAEDLSFSIDVSKGLSNGDTVTVSVSNDEEEFLESDGVILSPLEQEYTVAGLSQYLDSLDEISSKDLELMKDKVETQFRQHVAEGWITRLWSAPGFDYIGACLLTPTKGEGNILYLICQVNAECFEETGTGFSDQLFTYYYYARTENVLLDADGSIDVGSLDFVMPTDTYNLYSTYNVFGYQTLDQMYDAIEKSGYTCEKQVKDQDFGYTPVKMDTITEIPEDAVAYNGHYYKMYGVENMTWDQAKLQCEIRGGHLATITSEEEWQAIAVYVFGDSGADVWIGGYYAGGAWQWVTGEAMSEIGWTNGVPDASDAAAYPYLGTSSWRWRNFTYAGTHDDNYTVGYICEWE